MKFLEEVNVTSVYATHDTTQLDIQLRKIIL